MCPGHRWQQKHRFLSRCRRKFGFASNARAITKIEVVVREHVTVREFIWQRAWQANSKRRTKVLIDDRARFASPRNNKFWEQWYSHLVRNFPVKRAVKLPRWVSLTAIFRTYAAESFEKRIQADTIRRLIGSDIGRLEVDYWTCHAFASVIRTLTNNASARWSSSST